VWVLSGALGYTQATAGTGDFSWTGLATSTLIGAGTGALSGGVGAVVGSAVGSSMGSTIGSTAGSVIGGAASGVAAGGVGYVAGSLHTGQDMTWQGAGESMLLVGAMGGLGGVLAAKPGTTTTPKPTTLAKPGVSEPLVCSSVSSRPGVPKYTTSELADMASTIKSAPDVNPIQLKQQVIAVGANEEGVLVAGSNSSSSFTPSQRTMLDQMGIVRAPSRTVDGVNLQAEENVLGALADVSQIGVTETPCQAICSPLLDKFGVQWEVSK